MDRFLQVGRGHSCPVREIEYLNTQVFQIIILAIPIVSHDKSVDIQLFDYFGMIQRMLWNDNIGSFQCFDDLQTFRKRNDRLRLIRRHQFIRTHPHNQNIPKAAVPEKMKVVDEQVADVVEQYDGTDTDNDAQAGAAGSSEAVESQTAALSPVAVDEDDNPLNFQVIERLPEFPGGMVEFMKWLTKNLSYPVIAQQQKIQGKVLVSFIINKDGTISSPKVVKSVSPELDREALRVIRIMPKWKPGEDHGKPCRTYFCIPVVFKL